ncbi:protein kinase [Streptomyces sp. R39]|uniref:Protein kinase n=1 Tax=Streptomyces sp. R39 TaxID=3238631 RepID=A0AB39R3Y3_9ACTN
MTGAVLLDGDEVALLGPSHSGGQAEIFHVPDRPDLIVKIYRERIEGKDARRLARIVTMTPPSCQGGIANLSPELAWPSALVHAPNGAIIGYAMRYFGHPDHFPLAALIYRRTRLRYFKHSVASESLVRAGRNLSSVVATMHRGGIVVGDLSDRNIVVDLKGFVTLLDCDSVSFTDPTTGEFFPSTVYTPEYGAPERFLGQQATKATDVFALAVLLYLLLTAGSHPFAGVPVEERSAEASIDRNIIDGQSYVVHGDRMIVPKWIPDPETVLAPRLLDMFKAAFGPGLSDLAARPRADEWLTGLDHALDDLRPCPVQPHHAYDVHLPACPWCAQTEATGDDPFA